MPANYLQDGGIFLWKCLHDAAPPYLVDLCVSVHFVHGRQLLRLRRLELCWSRASGSLLVCAVSPSLDHERGTFCQLNAEHQI